MADTQNLTPELLARIETKLDRATDDPSIVNAAEPDRLKDLIERFAALSPEEQAKSIAQANAAIQEGRL